MLHKNKLIKATLIKRYKRFLADACLENGEVITAHCPNTGSMQSCGLKGDTILLSYNPSPKRKLSYTWEYTQTRGGYIGVNTSKTNHLVVEAIRNKTIPSLRGFTNLKTEVRYGTNSRIDILLEEPASNSSVWIEVKNVTLLKKDTLLFPDAVTARGLKHIKELTAKISAGDRGVMFFLVNRPEGTLFRPAKDIHPEYALELEKSHKAGLEILVYRTSTDLMQAKIAEPLEWAF